MMDVRRKAFPITDVFPLPVVSRAKRGMTRVDLSDLGFIPPVIGGNRGIHHEGDIITQTVDGRDLNIIWTEFQRTIQLMNAKRTALVRFLTFPVVNPVEDVPDMSTDDFEVATEYGEPKSIRMPGKFVSRAYYFEWFDLATRFTWKFLANASAAQLESANNAALEADNRLVLREVLRTIYNPTNLTTTITGQPYNVYKFYNNDGTTPPPYAGTTFLSTHTHYMTSGAASFDGTDVEALANNVREHGYNTENGYTLILLVNKQEGDVIRQFKVGVGGALYDFVPSLGTNVNILLPAGTTLVGPGQPASTLNGLTQIGMYGDIHVVQNDFVPPGYMTFFATGGEDNINNPVGLREHANAGLRGLRLVKGRTADYPLIDAFYNRGFGTGIRIRGAGAVMQVTAGAYAAPAAYTQPYPG